MLGAWVELAAVPAALISITNYSYMLSACVWLANDLYTSTVAKYILHQACRGIFPADYLHVNIRTDLSLVKSFKLTVS